MNKWNVVVFLVCFGSISQAQTSNATSTLDAAAGFTQWAKSQQVNVGLGYDWHRTRYVTTSWDLLSAGQSGLNVARAGAADYLDLGPVTSAANAARTRYGALPLVHWGNVWNGLYDHLPHAIQDHVYTTRLPDVAAGLAVFEPVDGVLTHWRWMADTQFVLVYRFGGTP